MENKFKKLISLFTIANQEKLIRKVQEDIYFNDTPRVPSFVVGLKYKNALDQSRRYSSLSKTKCLGKLLGETLERYSLSFYNKSNFIWENYENLKKKAIHPKELSISEHKETPPIKVYTNDKEKLNWVKTICLNDNKGILIPAQLVYLPYNFIKNEPLINFSTSNGTAFSTTYKKAILTGLLEVIERDAFMINYLNKLSRNIIEINKTKDKNLKQIVSLTERYKLKLFIVDISTDVPVYSILSILIDETGFGPAVSMGTKSGLNITPTIIGAIEECFQVYPWIRRAIILRGEKEIRKIQKNKNYISGILERGLLWSTPNMIKKINFFLEGKKVSINNFPSRKIRNLNALLNWFKKKEIKVICANITPLNILKKRFFTVKILIPQFQPLYLDERFPCWKGKRLKKVPQKSGFKPLKEVYKFPHPFL